MPARVAQCADGLEMMCADATEAGLFTDGGYAERMWVKDRRYLARARRPGPGRRRAPRLRWPDRLPGGEAHRRRAARSHRSAAGSLVIGAGGLGQYAIRYLRAPDRRARDRARHVAPTSVDTALEIGADTAIAPADDDVEPSVDVVIDFIGVERDARRRRRPGRARRA